LQARRQHSREINLPVGSRFLVELPAATTPAGVADQNGMKLSMNAKPHLLVDDEARFANLCH
jgi:hypothetical protein